MSFDFNDNIQLTDTSVPNVNDVKYQTSLINHWMLQDHTTRMVHIAHINETSAVSYYWFDTPIDNFIEYNDKLSSIIINENFMDASINTYFISVLYKADQACNYVISEHLLPKIKQSYNTSKHFNIKLPPLLGQFILHKHISTGDTFYIDYDELFFTLKFLYQIGKKELELDPHNKIVLTGSVLTYPSTDMINEEKEQWTNIVLPWILSHEHICTHFIIGAELMQSICNMLDIDYTSPVIKKLNSKQFSLYYQAIILDSIINNDNFDTIKEFKYHFPLH